MESIELRSLCASSKLNSISKAAKSLGLGQSTVTTHIKRLEDELGVKLIDRANRPIRVTPAGARLVQLATPILGKIDSFKGELPGANQETPITIAAGQDHIPGLLRDVVHEFRILYPKTQLQIRAGILSEATEMVAKGIVDLGLLARPENKNGFDFERLIEFERVLFTPLDHPLLASGIVSLDQIVDWPLIVLRKGTCTRTAFEAATKKTGLKYDIVIELDNMDLVKEYVAKGLGIGIGSRPDPDSHSKTAIGMLSLSHLLPPEEVGIVTIRGKTLSPSAALFVQAAREAFASSA